MIQTKHISRTLSLVLALLALAACLPQQPIPVYITATPAVPTATETPVPTLEPLPSNTHAPDVDVSAPTRTPLMVGPVVGPDYTLEPSNTPRPTRTPIVTVPPRPTDVPAGPSPTPLPGLDPNRMGVQVYTNLGRDEWNYYLERTNELGVGWIKVQMSWAFLQPNGQNPNEEVLRTFELNLETADQAGYNIMLSVAKAPQWARSSSDESGPPDNPQALADFLTMVFTETKIGRVADAIEIWNEPNLRREWNTALLPFSGAGYMQLFTPAYNAIRAYRPDLQIITAGLAPTTTSDFSVDDRAYLRQMYDAGLGSYTDVSIGVHPYGWGNPPDARCCGAAGDPGWDENPHFFFLDNLDETRAIMSANGHGDVPMWVTEFGWSTWRDLGVPLPQPEANYLFMDYASPEDQANYAIRAFEIGLNERTDIAGMILWNLNFANDLTIGASQEIVGYSMLLPPGPQDPNNIRRRPLAYLLPLAIAQGQ